MARTENNPWLHYLAVITAFASLVLIGMGGLVTSHGAGMAVPDWPTTYGYNMFLFPTSMWTGGIFYEHTHRLFAAGVGLLTTVLAVWLWLKEARRWLRWQGFIAFVGILLQGVLGGLRVVWLKNELGTIHAALAQMFLVLVSSIALFTSPRWPNLSWSAKAVSVPKGLWWLMLSITLLVLGQLVIAATMRHQHAGLAIPDFPLAYGRLWPVTDAESVARYNQNRIEITAANPITAFQIVLQMVHRIVAVVILVAVALCGRAARRKLGGRNPVTKLAVFWLALLIAQVALGAATIWSNKAADVATAHVVVGALTLVVGAFLNIATFQSIRKFRGSVASPSGGETFDSRSAAAETAQLPSLR